MRLGHIRTVGALALILLMPPAIYVTAAENARGAPRAMSPRITRPLMSGWRFVLDDQLTDDSALTATGSRWASVTLPHTWNAHDAATTHATVPYKRGIGWYRLEFEAPRDGARTWLEFGAASIVADVWLNGVKLGEHKGAFTVFRFDVTDRLRPSGKNVLLVKVDNRAPETKDDPTAIIPLQGDFNMSGGLYRHVSLISTADPVHFDLGDLGGPGVYATTTSISGDHASVRVLARLKSDAAQDGAYVVRASLLDAGGRIARSAEETVSLRAGQSAAIAQDLEVDKVRLWQGVDDPYQYKLVLELRRTSGEPIDQVAQRFGIRQMRFDPDHGFFLNGKHVRLHGVAMHQDLLGKGWAISDRDIDHSLAMIQEIGANTVRFGHYPFPAHALDRADELGLVVWAEVPLGIGVTVEPAIKLGEKLACPTEAATPALRANAEQQLRELIRQDYNHAAVGMWSIGNEVTFLAQSCPPPPYDNVTPVLRELQAVARQEDPGRVTTLADFTSKAIPPLQGEYIAVGGISDIWAINQYYLWYGGPVVGLGRQLDALHARYPDQPIGMSEYGAGAALSHHTDNPLGGPAENTNTGQPVVYQPEEYAGYVHEQNDAMLSSRDYVWGTYVWNMFDFGSGLRKEGDVQGVNTKGLVTFDHETRKEPFYFYKANWSRAPVTHIVGRRYTNRAYSITNVKVYSNADSIQLSVNGRPVGTMTQAQCQGRTCVFENVKLRRGNNEVVATGDHGGAQVRDQVAWSLDHDDINIAAGQLTTGFRSQSGQLFGSDNFFIGGAGDWLVGKSTKDVKDRTAVRGARDPQLFANYRRGTFRYEIPVSDGTYEVTLGLLEPDRTTEVGTRTFDVVANGQPRITKLDVLNEAGAYRTVIYKRFPVVVSGGLLTLDFRPTRGEAVVSNIAIAERAGAETYAVR
jgi:beta-galactosidase